MNLKLYAANESESLGRLYKEKISPIRNDFQRDRDRIIHSTSFRRLQYKTQVFVSHEGDMFRNRLTHSIEVSQISRGVARCLGCHEDLTEAIALAHDLGHTPFGHAGQDALNNRMKNYGGFEHNLQSLRVIDTIESKYAEFRGLNLTFETREGILKHCSKKNARQLGAIGKRFLDNTQPTLEAQIVNIADEIAYCHHDIDDGFRSKILNFDLLKKLDLFQRFYFEVVNHYSNISPEQIVNESIRKMMYYIISDLNNQSLKNICQYNPKSVVDVRTLPPLISFSAEVAEQIQDVKQFARFNLYNHPRIQKMAERAESTINNLFDYFIIDHAKVPENYRHNRDEPPARIVADYIAGMTDRFAIDLESKIV